MPARTLRHPTTATPRGADTSAVDTSPRTTFGRYSYFISRDYPVGGQRINLYDLEREVLIPDFREPRIHFAIVSRCLRSRNLPSLLPLQFMITFPLSFGNTRGFITLTPEFTYILLMLKIQKCLE